MVLSEIRECMSKKDAIRIHPQFVVMSAVLLHLNSLTWQFAWRTWLQLQQFNMTALQYILSWQLEVKQKRLESLVNSWIQQWIENSQAN